MKILVLLVAPIFFLSACAVPDPYPVYVDRPVDRPVIRHHYVKAKSDDFQAVEKPDTYTNKSSDE